MNIIKNPIALVFLFTSLLFLCSCSNKERMISRDSSREIITLAEEVRILEQQYKAVEALVLDREENDFSRLLEGQLKTPEKIEWITNTLNADDDDETVENIVKNIIDIELTSLNSKRLYDKYLKGRLNSDMLLRWTGIATNGSELSDFILKEKQHIAKVESLEIAAKLMAKTSESSRKALGIEDQAEDLEKYISKVSDEIDGRIYKGYGKPIFNYTFAIEKLTLGENELFVTGSSDGNLRVFTSSLKEKADFKNA